jgi:hypothetical protein
MYHGDTEIARKDRKGGAQRPQSNKPALCIFFAILTVKFS